MKLSEALEKYGDCEVKQELVDLIDKNPKTIYDLKVGDKYFCLSCDGEISVYNFINNKFCKDCLSMGNAFLTKKEAENYKEKLEVEAILRKYSYKFSEKEWEDGCVNKFCIRYNRDDNVIEATYVFVCKMQGTIYFKNKANANRAILKVGICRLTKYLKEK